MAELQESWPSGATWVFQGTIAEDGSAGTHVCTLTVTPGIGNELIVDGGRIVVGATATAQSATAYITDGTNITQALLNPGGLTDTTSGARYSFPNAGGTIALYQNSAPIYKPSVVSGTMQLVLAVSTTAVSVTQTFAVICRIRGMAKPTATLADTVGTPTLTTNTNQVF